MNILRRSVISGIFLSLGLVLISPVYALPIRSFNQIFPSIGEIEKGMVFSTDGLRRSFKKNESQSVVPGPDSEVDLMSIVLKKNPAQFIETVWLVPHVGKLFNTLEIYNALGRVADIKNHPYQSRTASLYLFEESVRLESAVKNNPIPDPAPVETLPDSESVHMRLKDKYFGTIYVRGDVSPTRYGIIFSLTNYKAIRFLLFPVLRAEKFTAVVYFEPIVEGILVYTMSAVDIPDFFLARGNIIRDMDRRFTILSNWLSDGLKKGTGI
jgi:hypothetical protein